MKGELNFESLLRIDGRFEGALSSSGSLIVGRSGVLVGDISGSHQPNVRVVPVFVCLKFFPCFSHSGMVELLCEGKVIGNVSVERAELRGTSSIFGNITCKVSLGAPRSLIAVCEFNESFGVLSLLISEPYY